MPIAVLEPTTGTAPKILRYPLNIGQSTSPAIMFSSHTATYGKADDSIIKDLGYHIALHVVPGVSFNDNIQYEERSGGVIGSILDSGGKFDLSLEGLKGGAKDIMDGGSALISTPAGKVAVGAVIAKNVGLAAGGIAGTVIAGGLDELTKKTQVVLRENPFITFKGVGLREWSFSWAFIPESREESLVVKDIIRNFRKSMYPKKSPFTLNFPEVFDIEFINAQFPKMPEVALQSCSVVYNKDSNSFFKENDEPVRVDMTLNFRELMPIYRSHVEKGY